MKRSIILFSVAALMFAGSKAAAQSNTDEATGGADPAAEQGGKASDLDEPGEDTSYSHFFQFGIRAGLVGGYRMVFRYDESPLCTRDDVVGNQPVARDDQQKFCGFGGPLGVDLALSFAPLGPIEPYVWTRLGLSGEPDTNTKPVRILGVGVRIYTMHDAAFKVFIEPAVGYEFEGGGGHLAWRDYEYKQDMVFHVAVGPQIDVARGFGIYLDGGLTVGILRAIHTSMELQGGIQVRFP